MKSNSTLSIFVDESGDFGFKEGSSKRYILSLVFHDQANDISGDCQRIKDLPTFHAGPLVRKEPPFESDDIMARSKIWRRFFIFFMALPIRCKTFLYGKKDFGFDNLAMEKRMARDLYSFLQTNGEYFSSFGSIIVYYDKGQRPITRMLNQVFAISGFNYSFKERVKPSNYRLFQAADFVSMIKLVEAKMLSGELSASEKSFFKPRTIKKNYIKAIAKKEL